MLNFSKIPRFIIQRLPIMSEEFFPTISNLSQLFKNNTKLIISTENQSQLKQFQEQNQKSKLSLICLWAGLLAWDINRFFLKDKSLLLKIFRTKYHIFSAFGCISIYTYMDFQRGFRMIEMLGKDDVRYFTLKHPNSAI